jgi:hypothetical protein
MTSLLRYSVWSEKYDDSKQENPKETCDRKKYQNSSDWLDADASTLPRTCSLPLASLDGNTNSSNPESSSLSTLSFFIFAKGTMQNRHLSLSKCLHSNYIGMDSTLKAEVVKTLNLKNGSEETLELIFLSLLQTKPCL